MPSKYLVINLTDYLFANGGVITPDREVIFTEYNSGIMSLPGSAIVHGPSTYTSCWGHTVTNVRMCDKGYAGTTKDGKEMIVEEGCATIHLPVSILKGT